MMPIPPIPTTTAINDVVFWGLIGFMVVLFLLATILWIVTSRRISQKSSQTQEAERQYEATPPYPYNEQEQVQQAKEEALLR
jgi:hypothetical protein